MAKIDDIRDRFKSKVEASTAFPSFECKYIDDPADLTGEFPRFLLLPPASGTIDQFNIRAGKTYQIELWIFEKIPLNDTRDKLEIYRDLEDDVYDILAGVTSTTYTDRMKIDGGVTVNYYREDAHDRQLAVRFSFDLWVANCIS
jgi:hypothetical protein